MTKIITRYFDSVSKARSVVNELVERRRLSPHIVSLFDRADGLEDALSSVHVDGATAQAYKKQMVERGGAVLMVMAGHKPLGVAQTTRDVMAQMGAAEMIGAVQEVEVYGVQRPTLSVLGDHPFMMSRARSPYATKTFHMANWPIPLISRRKPFTPSLIEPHARMANFPIGLTNRRKPFTGSIFSRHARMANFPISLISRRKPFTGSIFSRHARMANFPISLTSRRKPFTGTLIGRHTRMANWPFPHLIDGKSTNSLMPGGPRMANFPISLLSNRKPFTGSIFSRHARMANFPLSLISRRKPFTGSIFDRHARMADFILPLVFKSSQGALQHDKRQSSLSKLLSLPTVIRR